MLAVRQDISQTLGIADRFPCASSPPPPCPSRPPRNANHCCARAALHPSPHTLRNAAELIAKFPPPVAFWSSACLFDDLSIRPFCPTRLSESGTYISRFCSFGCGHYPCSVSWMLTQHLTFTGSALSVKSDYNDTRRYNAY